MPVYNPRTRLVNFRVSEDEYQRLKDTCARSGARSVSDYARSAVLTGSSLEAAPLTGLTARLEACVTNLSQLAAAQQESLVAHG